MTRRTTTRHLATAGGYLHISSRPTPGSIPLEYDWADFASEFADLVAGSGRYKLDGRLLRFLRHFVGQR